MEHTEDSNYSLKSKQFRMAPKQISVLKSSWSGEFMIVKFYQSNIDVYTHSATPVFLFRQQFSYLDRLHFMFFEYNTNTKATSFVSYRIKTEVIVAGYIQILKDSIVITETHSTKKDSIESLLRTSGSVYWRQDETYLIVSETKIMTYLFKNKITCIEYDPTSNIFRETDFDLKQEMVLSFFKTEIDDVVGHLCILSKVRINLEKEEITCLRVGFPNISNPHLYTFRFINTKTKKFCSYLYNEDIKNEYLTSFLLVSYGIRHIVHPVSIMLATKKIS
eukprot:GAHX01001420.1.p1 GENE.GAHX01001420.1~~GAHX01001420.1.p1  ORF type:complete len:277 (+),score=42.85 GAHX01001420.1:197-1027(+)